MSDRALGVGDYLFGAAELGLILGALAYAAVCVRRAALPGFSGPPALVADLVAGLSLAVVLSETLGTFEAFTELGLVMGAMVVAVLARLISARLARSGETEVPPAPPGHRLGLPIVALVVAAIFATWAIPTLSGITGGMSRADSLWYHMPLSLRFVETGSTSELFFFDPIFFASFYPANSEVLHAIPILTFGRDFLSPLLNLGFLGFGLVSAWAIGRPYGLAPQALLGAAVILGAETMTDFQAGESLNDICGVVFLLAGVALLINGRSVSGDGRIAVGALAFAGAAVGLAAGTKLSFLAPAALLTLAVIAIAPRGFRLRSTVVWSIPMLIAGGYWYARNLLTVGNPIPYSAFGPLGLPAPERAFELRPGFSVAHYWDEPGVWAEWFAPKLAEELGIFWPLVLLGVLWTGIRAFRRGDTLTRALGAVALLTAAAYLVTPLTAGGEEGEPIAFEWNVRYLAPAVAIGLAVLPIVPPFNSTPRWRSSTLFGLGALALFTTFTVVQWSTGGHVKGAIATGVLVASAFVAAAWLARRGWIGTRANGRAVAAVGVGVALAALAAGFVVQRHYLERRYEDLSPQLGLANTVRWANEARNERIAVSGIRGVFNQYALTGPDLSNHVQWLGIEGADKAYLRIPDCETWREEINRGEYTYVVTMYDPFNPLGLTDTKEAVWTREDPGASQIIRDGPVNVFEIVSDLDPGACGNLPDLVPAELNGDSVNEEPFANQPAPGLTEPSLSGGY